MSAPASPQLCPSCAGQIVAGAPSCQWCGASLIAAEATRVAASPPPLASGPKIGFGGNAALPPIPPPPKELPRVQLNSTQVFLRVLIIIGLLYVVLVIGQQMVVSARNTACAVPSPLCR